MSGRLGGSGSGSGSGKFVISEAMDCVSKMDGGRDALEPWFEEVGRKRMEIRAEGFGLAQLIDIFLEVMGRECHLSKIERWIAEDRQGEDGSEQETSSKEILRMAKDILSGTTKADAGVLTGVRNCVLGYDASVELGKFYNDLAGVVRNTSDAKVK
jgi:hypothetical protein